MLYFLHVFFLTMILLCIYLCYDLYQAVKHLGDE
nr:MAG TPA: hypothetical protein [Caudoviricetes sp.]DAX43600.1 MAG TPA: hypothetical protein [Caudoviricetes sp.]